MPPGTGSGERRNKDEVAMRFVTADEQIHLTAWLAVPPRPNRTVPRGATSRPLKRPWRIACTPVQAVSLQLMSDSWKTVRAREGCHLLPFLVVSDGVADYAAAARCPGKWWDHDRWSRQIRWRGEIEDLSEIVGCSISHGKWLQSEAPFDRLQYRSVVVGAVRNIMASGPGGDDEAGDPKASQAGSEVGAGVGRVTWDDVVKESAPLVIVDDKHGACPIRTSGDCLVNLGKERLTGADISVRMVVA
jgi:hypothetical protein